MALRSRPDIEVFDAILRRPAPARQLLRATKALGYALPPQVVAIHTKANGMCVRWEHQSLDLAGDLHIASLQEMFTGLDAGPGSWSADRLEDVTWFEGDDDIRGKELAGWLRRCKLWSVIEGSGDNIVIDLAAKPTPTLHWVTDDRIHPLSLSPQAFVQWGVRCLGAGYWFAAFAPKAARRGTEVNTLPKRLAQLGGEQVEVAAQLKAVLQT